MQRSWQAKQRRKLRKLSRKAALWKSRSKRAKSYVVISDDGGVPCPRCGRPTQVREHAAITDKLLRQPYYFSRWFRCLYRDCKVTLIMVEKYKVYTADQLTWGDSWDDVDGQRPLL